MKHSSKAKNRKHPEGVCWQILDKCPWRNSLFSAEDHADEVVIRVTAFAFDSASGCTKHSKSNAMPKLGECYALRPGGSQTGFCETPGFSEVLLRVPRAPGLTASPRNLSRVNPSF